LPPRARDAGGFRDSEEGSAGFGRSIRWSSCGGAARIELKTETGIKNSARPIGM